MSLARALITGCVSDQLQIVDDKASYFGNQTTELLYCVTE